MKVSRGFVKTFLLLFLIVIGLNLLAFGLGYWNSWYLVALCGFTLVLFFLIYRKKDNGTVKFFKFLVLLIPLIVLGFIFYSNFIASQEFVYNYDIGGEKDIAKSYLSPLNRISSANDSYRNLTGQLVYFDVPVPRGADRITIVTKMKVPENSSVLLGAKNKAEWSYLSKSIYNPLLESLNLTGQITRLNPSMPIIDSVNDIPSGSVVATDLDIPLVEKKQNFSVVNSTFNYYLRDSHTFYVYLDGSLDLYVEKQDINWYSGADELQIGLLDLKGNLLGNTTILDDGVTNTSRIILKATNGALRIGNLSRGVYILELNGGSDTIITKIKINTNKIVTNKIFSAESANYIKENDTEVEFYTNPSRSKILRVQTYHTTYLQNITINSEDFEIKNVSNKLAIPLSNGEKIISAPRSNIIFGSNSYLTFSGVNYFEPLQHAVLSIPSKQEELTGIDYILNRYTPTKKQDGWLISETNFDVKDLYINNGKLNLLFNVPVAENQTIFFAIDSINVAIQKDGWKI